MHFWGLSSTEMWKIGKKEEKLFFFFGLLGVRYELSLFSFFFALCLWHHQKEKWCRGKQGVCVEKKRKRAETF